MQKGTGCQEIFIGGGKDLRVNLNDSSSLVKSKQLGVSNINWE